MVKRALYPGTFDPMTNGHLDIIQQAIELVDELIVAVAPTSRKNPLLTLPERLELLEQVLKSYTAVKVQTLPGLAVDFAKEQGACVLVRGLRTAADCDYELQLAHMNRRMSPHIQTVFIPAIESRTYLSGTIVKEIIALGNKNIELFVPPLVAEYLQQKYRGTGGP